MFLRCFSVCRNSINSNNNKIKLIILLMVNEMKMMKMILMMTVRMMNWYVVMARVVYGTKHTVWCYHEV